MTDFDSFRITLATTLLSAADRRRRSSADCRPSGEDLKILALLERLAADAARLDPHVYAICGAALAQEPLARRFMQRRDDLLAEIGITVCPPSATALVTWLHGQVIDDVTTAGRGGPESRDAGVLHVPFSKAQISISVPISTTCEGGTSK